MIMLYIVIAALFCCVIFQQVIHSAERKDLYNRLMARDYKEYAYSNKKVNTRNPIMSAHSRTLEKWRSEDGGDK